MSSDVRDRFAPVLDHVRENPTADLSVEALARVAHYSAYHFHRSFTAAVGETPGIFVRRARLERAVQLMRASPDRSLGTVALEAGFGSHSDFSRTFRRHYGTAPSRWDRRTPLVFRTPTDEAAGDPPWDARRMAEADRGPPVRVAFDDRPASSMAFVRIREPFLAGRLEEGYDRLRAWLRARGLPEAPGGLHGMSWDDVEATPPEQIRYDFACPVPAGTSAGDGVGVREVPAFRFVRAPARGDLNRVARVWHHLYHEWLPRSSHEPFNLPAFELYRGWPSALDPEAWDLDCCIPLGPPR